MTQTKKRSKKAAKKTKVKAAQKLPTEGEDEAPATLPRGQERLPDGTIRLKTGVHDLGKNKVIYDVWGARVQLNGKVIVANKDVDWLSIGKCAKCSTKRPGGITVVQSNDLTVLMFKCSNKKGCDIGGLLYVQVHGKGRFKGFFS